VGMRSRITEYASQCALRMQQLSKPSISVLITAGRMQPAQVLACKQADMHHMTQRGRATCYPRIQVHNQLHIYTNADADMHTYIHIPLCTCAHPCMLHGVCWRGRLLQQQTAQARAWGPLHAAGNNLGKQFETCAECNSVSNHAVLCLTPQRINSTGCTTVVLCMVQQPAIACMHMEL
jgi:hypothetical protein